MHGGGERPVVEQAGSAGGHPRQPAEPQPESDHDQYDEQKDDGQTHGMTGRGASGRVEQFGDLAPQPVQGTAQQTRVVLVVGKLGQLALRGLAGSFPRGW